MEARSDINIDIERYNIELDKLKASLEKYKELNSLFTESYKKLCDLHAQRTALTSTINENYQADKKLEKKKLTEMQTKYLSFALQALQLKLDESKELENYQAQQKSLQDQAEDWRAKLSAVSPPSEKIPRWSEIDQNKKKPLENNIQSLQRSLEIHDKNASMFAKNIELLGGSIALQDQAIFKRGIFTIIMAIYLKMTTPTSSPSVSPKPSPPSSLRSISPTPESSPHNSPHVSPNASPKLSRPGPTPMPLISSTSSPNLTTPAPLSPTSQARSHFTQFSISNSSSSSSSSSSSLSNSSTSDLTLGPQHNLEGGGETKKSAFRKIP